MHENGAPTVAAREYAAAYAFHYSERDLATALQLYRQVIVLHGGAREAGYSRTQVANIVNAIVPEQELLEAQVKLALTRLEYPTASARGFEDV